MPALLSATSAADQADRNRRDHNRDQAGQVRRDAWIERGEVDDDAQSKGFEWFPKRTVCMR